MLDWLGLAGPSLAGLPPLAPCAARNPGSLPGAGPAARLCERLRRPPRLRVVTLQLDCVRLHRSARLAHARPAAPCSSRLWGCGYTVRGAKHAVCAHRSVQAAAHVTTHNLGAPC